MYRSATAVLAADLAFALACDAATGQRGESPQRPNESRARTSTSPAKLHPSTAHSLRLTSTGTRRGAVAECRHRRSQQPNRQCYPRRPKPSLALRQLCAAFSDNRTLALLPSGAQAPPPKLHDGRSRLATRPFPATHRGAQRSSNRRERLVVCLLRTATTPPGITCGPPPPLDRVHPREDGGLLGGCKFGVLHGPRSQTTDSDLTPLRERAASTHDRASTLARTNAADAPKADARSRLLKPLARTLPLWPCNIRTTPTRAQLRTDDYQRALARSGSGGG